MELIKQMECTIPFQSDGSVVKLLVESISREERKNFLIAATSKKKNIESNGKSNMLETVDFDKLNTSIIRRAVKGWSGLKNKHLPIIYDCKEKANEWSYFGDGKRETEIPYSEDQKRELSNVHSDNFMTMLNLFLDDIDDANAEAKEAELKN